MPHIIDTRVGSDPNFVRIRGGKVVPRLEARFHQTTADAAIHGGGGSAAMTFQQQQQLPRDPIGVGAPIAQSIFGDIFRFGKRVVKEIVGGGDGGFPPGIPGRTGPLNVQGLALPTGTGAGSGCLPFFVRNERGQCVPGLGQSVGSDEAALAGLGQPDVVASTRRVCRRGSVLDLNGFCRDKRTISNRDRMWPKQRRPLMTGGDLNAISTASRAASRLKVQTKRLQKLGMISKPRRPCPK